MNPRLRLLLVVLLPPAVGCGVQWLLWDDWLSPYAWVLFYPVAFAGAWLGGLKGGIGVTAISALLVWYVLLPPRFSFELQTASGYFSIAVFVAMGGLLCWVFERLRRAQALARAGYDATFEQAAVGIGLVAPDGRWLRVNRRLCSIVGYTPAELMTRTFQDITHPDDLEADLDQVRRMLVREIDTYSMEKRYLRKDGGIVWINLTVALVWKADGTPDHFISVVEDISARKQAEQRFAQLFEQAPVALATSNREGRIVLTNRAFIEMFGYRAEDTPTLGEWRARVLADLSQQAAADADWDQKWQPGDKRAEMVEHAVICRDGRRRTVLLSRQRLGEEMMLAAIDISERKDAELAAREQIHELERFHRASVGRELDMIGLKREVNALARELGRAPRYDLSFADDLDEKDRR